MAVDVRQNSRSGQIYRAWIIDPQGRGQIAEALNRNRAAAIKALRRITREAWGGGRILRVDRVIDGKTRAAAPSGWVKANNNVHNPTAAQLNRCKKLLDDERASYERPTITYNRNSIWDAEQIRTIITSLENEIPRLEKELERFDITTGAGYSRAKLTKEKIATAKRDLAGFKRELKTKNPQGVPSYVVPDRETMTRFLGKIIKNHKVGDQVEISFKGKRYIWQKYSANGWQKIKDKENPIQSNRKASPAEVNKIFTRAVRALRKHKPTGTAIDTAKLRGEIRYYLNRDENWGEDRNENWYAELAWNFRKRNGAAVPRKANFSKADFRRLTKERLQELSKMFQGEATGTRIKTVAPDAMPDDTFRLGWLKKLIFKTPDGKRVSWDFSGNSLLSADIRCNLWVSGTSAQIKNLRGGLPKKPDYKVLGDLVQVEYVTAKRHIESGRTVRFWHPMGEVTKQFPKIAVDYDGFPIMIGGGYDIWNVGIVD